MLKPTNAAWSISQIIYNLPVMSPQGFPQQILKTFNCLMKVTKKITQRNFLEKLFKLGLPTKHADFITRRILAANKSSFRSDPCYKQHITKTIMHMELQDAAMDVEETRKKAGLSVKEMLSKAKSVLYKTQINILKSNFFRLVSEHRNYLWNEQKMRCSRAISFKMRKSGLLPHQQPIDNPFTVSVHPSGETTTDGLTVESLKSKFPEDHPEDLYGKLGGSSLRKIGVHVSDKDLEARYEEESTSRNPIVYGGVNLGDDEANVLLLHPKLRLLEPLQEEQMEHEMEKCLSDI